MISKMMTISQTLKTGAAFGVISNLFVQDNWRPRKRKGRSVKNQNKLVNFNLGPSTFLP